MASMSAFPENNDTLKLLYEVLDLLVLPHDARHHLLVHHNCSQARMLLRVLDARECNVVPRRIHRTDAPRADS